jgi:hypothetical protein
VGKHRVNQNTFTSMTHCQAEKENLLAIVIASLPFFLIDKISSKK